MPLLSSQSGVTAKAFGLTSSQFASIGGGYWAAWVIKASPAADMFSGFNSTTIDSSGNLFLGLRVNQVDATAYLYKVDSAGAIVWQTYLGNTGTVEGFDTVTVDSSGNIYAAGYTTSAGNGLLITKYNSSGVLQWQKNVINTWTSSSVSDIAVDSSGNLYLSGSVYTGVGTPTLDAFVMKLDTSQNISWQRFLSASSDQFGSKLSLDSSGNNVYVLVNDVGVSPTYGSLVKYNSSGTLQWQRKLTPATGAGLYLYGITLDSSNNIYVGGYTTASPYNRAVLAKYDSSGVLQWGKDLSLSFASTYATDLKLDTSNNIYINHVISSAAYGYGVSKLDNSGSILWSREVRYNNGGNGTTVEVNGSDVYSTGGYSDGGIQTQTICKFPTDGTRTGIYKIPGVTGPVVLYTGLSSSVASNSWADQAGTLTDSAGNFFAPTNTTLTSAAGLLTSYIVT
jgi:outer membrane protein assembly factor BamB